MKIIKVTLVLFVFFVSVTTAIIYSGVVNVSADEPHSKPVYWLLEKIRTNAINKAAQSIIIPDLNAPELLLSGGNDYESMCSGCHLKPGQTVSDMSIGLYPAPPNLSLTHKEHSHEHADDNSHEMSKDFITQQTRNNFWVIKHGIKASGMPAWGKTHDDKRIWAMVAFLQKLPDLTPGQYQILTAND